MIMAVTFAVGLTPWTVCSPDPSVSSLELPAHLASLQSAGDLWTGTAPCPAGKLPRRTSAAPSASAAGCAPFPGPSVRVLYRVQLKKQSSGGESPSGDWTEGDTDSAIEDGSIPRTLPC